MLFESQGRSVPSTKPMRGQISAAHPGSAPASPVPVRRIFAAAREGQRARQSPLLLLRQTLFKNPPADVPVRVPEPVVAVAAGEARIAQTVVQVAPAQPPTSRTTSGCAANPCPVIDRDLSSPQASHPSLPSSVRKAHPFRCGSSPGQTRLRWALPRFFLFLRTRCSPLQGDVRPLYQAAA